VGILRANPGISGANFERAASDMQLGRNQARNFLRNGVGDGRIRMEKKGARRSHFLSEKA